MFEIALIVMLFALGFLTALVCFTAQRADAKPQQRVAAWVAEALGDDSARNAQERSLRTTEEAIELAQVCGVPRETLHRLVDYVFARPVGEAAQEVGGCLLTLYSTAAALDVDADGAFEAELARIYRPEIMEKVIRRQVEKREALVGDLPGGSNGNGS